MARRRRLVWCALALAVCSPSPCLASTVWQGESVTDPAPMRFPLVGTGDSILGLALGQPGGPGRAVLTADRWIDVEFGRNAYTAGMAGRASTASIWPLVVARSQPGGWVLIQDNGVGVSDDAWRSLWRRIAHELPADRCIIAVLPGFRADINPWLSDELARKARILGEELRSLNADGSWVVPCRRFVYLNAYMREFPEQFPDGQHPDPTAQAWIRHEVFKWTPNK